MISNIRNPLVASYPSDRAMWRCFVRLSQYDCAVVGLRWQVLVRDDFECPVEYIYIYIPPSLDMILEWVYIQVLLVRNKIHSSDMFRCIWSKFMSPSNDGERCKFWNMTTFKSFEENVSFSKSFWNKCISSKEHSKWERCFSLMWRLLSCVYLS